MSPFSISKARENFTRLAINAENVAQFVLLRGSRPALVVGTRQHQRQYRRHHSSSELQRRSQDHLSPQAPPLFQLAFRPSFQLNTQSLFNSSRSRAFSSFRPNPISPPLSSPRPRFATTQATTPSYTKPSYTKPTPATAPDQTSPSTSDPKSSQSYGDLTSGLSDEPITLDEGERQVDWARSFHGLSSQPFSKEAAETLMQPIPPGDVEVKPDGIIYLPEIKYRRILNKAFGPGGWGLAPRGETIITQRAVTREYALVAHGRLVSVARGEQEYFSADGIPTATEGCKSNALMRCCKDIGVASELWDPRYIRKFMKEHAREVWAEHVVTKKKKKVWTRKDDEVRYPFQAQK